MQASEDAMLLAAAFLGAPAIAFVIRHPKNEAGTWFGGIMMLFVIIGCATAGPGEINWIPGLIASAAMWAFQFREQSKALLAGASKVLPVIGRSLAATGRILFNLVRAITPYVVHLARNLARVAADLGRRSIALIRRP